MWFLRLPTQYDIFTLRSILQAQPKAKMHLFLRGAQCPSHEKPSTNANNSTQRKRSAPYTFAPHIFQKEGNASVGSSARNKVNVQDIGRVNKGQAPPLERQRVAAVVAPLVVCWFKDGVRSGSKARRNRAADQCKVQHSRRGLRSGRSLEFHFRMWLVQPAHGLP